MRPKRHGLEDIVRHATDMQRRVDQAREQVRDREVFAVSLEGKVRVTVTCEGKVKRIEADPRLLAEEGLDLVLDVIAATTNKALELADQAVEAEVTQATGGLRVPGVNG